MKKLKNKELKLEVMRQKHKQAKPEIEQSKLNFNKWGQIDLKAVDWWWFWICHYRLSTAASKFNEMDQNAYKMVKDAVLEACQMVPEAYRQRVRNKSDECMWIFGHWWSNGLHPRFAGLTAPVSTAKASVNEVVSSSQRQTKTLGADKIISGYTPFISDGFLSLDVREEKVPAKILRDSGPLDIFVRELVFHTFRSRELCFH